jgi:uncharacterized membrane protein YkoI
MKKKLILLIAASLPAYSMDLLSEYPVMRDHADIKLAHNHGGSENKSNKMPVSDMLTDIDKCVSAALGKYPGHILSMESEVENNRVIYEFDIKTKAGSEIEVECDALKHTLHDYELELSGDDKRFTSAVKISEQQAKDIALSKYNGKVVDVEYAMENNNPTYEFDIYVKDKGHEIEVEVDGVTGKILETEIELYDIGAE